MKNIKGLGFLVIIMVLLVLVAGAIWFKQPLSNVPPDPVACTMEAKICPDGSGVGRVGPKCEFAPCPNVVATPTATSTATTTPEKETGLEAGLGGKINNSGVQIFPLEVIQDSRCPTDVQCIQTGTVKLKAKIVSGLGPSEVIFTLGESITTKAEIITLTQVLPFPNSKQIIKKEDYRFTFQIVKR